MDMETLRVENDVAEIGSAPVRSTVLSRFEKKMTTNADRFIASRLVNRDLQTVNLTMGDMENCGLVANAGPRGAELPSVQMLKEQIFDGQVDSKILAYKDKAKPADAGHLNRMRVLFSQNRAVAPKKSTRAISCSAERVLDAPDISEDFYLNLLDWSPQNILAVALGQAVYLWNAASGQIDLLTELTDSSDSVCSLSWAADGHYLAIGTNNNNVNLWNVSAKKQLRTLTGHTARVGSLAWNNHLLSSGSRDSNIFNSDVRVAQHHVSTWKGHSLEVCGLKWSDDGLQLASGGNDNLVCIWDAAGNGSAPKRTFTHSAAVKALAWCPFQKNVLATGAGTADRHIRLYNTQSGALLSQVDTESQVSGLQWSKTEKELVSSHGFSQNQLSVWRYGASGLSKMADLTGHTSRILHLTMSPDATMVCSAASDETLRFWKVWDTPSAKKVDVQKSTQKIGAGMIR